MRTGTLFVLARTRVYHSVVANDYMQHLHALAITTGAEKFGGPKLIQASVSGKGAGSSSGQVAFDPLHENPRASLLLVNGNVILHLGFVVRRSPLPWLGDGLRCANSRAKSGAQCHP